MNFFDKVIDRRDTHCEKWDKYKGEDVIHTWIVRECKKLWIVYS